MTAANAPPYSFAEVNGMSKVVERPVVMRPSSAVAVGACATFALAMPTMTRTLSESWQVTGAIISVVVSCITALAYLHRSMSVDWSEIWMTPPGLLWVTASVVFGGASYYWLLPSSHSEFFTAYHLAVALLAVSLFVWTSLVGFALVAPWVAGWNPVERYDGLNERFPFAGVAAFGVGILATGVLLAMGRYSYVGDPAQALSESSSTVNVLTHATVAALYGAAIILWNGLTRRSSRDTVIGYVMFGALVVIGLASGFKGSAIVPILAVLIIYRLVRGRFPTGLILAAGVGLLLLFPINTAYRSDLRFEGLDPTQALPGAIGSALTGSLNDPLGVVSGTAATLSGRLRLIDSPAAIVSRTPSEIPYLAASRLPVDAVAGLVPRSLWPSKPINDEGYRFGQQFFDIQPEYYTSIAITIPGSAYQYGGLISVALIGALVGCYLAVLNRVANPMVVPVGLLLFLSVVRPLTALEASILPLITDQIQAGLVGLVAMFILIRRRDPSRDESDVFTATAA